MTDEKTIDMVILDFAQAFDLVAQRFVLALDLGLMDRT